ncbi:hypothetical protein [Mycobacterium sp. 236(2023)]|uniref:hypothetical protein n=1 Tax=Mycobacterium sp. 236(2023) TaxID=3038163 RepID=UPI00241559DE|nr:hypothetical protein [Mycobacterium sp. 236(2023)]MDG4663870.1 hypothetical protein [Mycobacterium sp. 236(2023)]
MGDVGGTMSFLAEWYLPDLAEATVDHIVTQLHTAAAALTGEGASVRLVATLSVPTDEVLYGVFEAASKDLVETTCERAGFPQQRLSEDVVARFVSGAA